MLILGLTGGIGSGKTTVTNMFSELGIDIIDADAIAKEIVQPNSACLSQIVEHFGSSILLENNQLNRAMLRHIIFTNSDERSWLEQLMHPLIRAEIKNQLLDATSPYAILSSPLLIETNQMELVDIIAVVDIPESMQITRTGKRDKQKEEHIRSIMDTQTSRTNRLSFADIVIDNSASLFNTQEQVVKMHRSLLSHE